LTDIDLLYHNVIMLKKVNNLTVSSKKVHMGWFWSNW